MTTLLSEDEVNRWNRDGFLVREEFADQATLDIIRVAFDEVLEANQPGDRMLGGVTRQVMVPADHHSVFAENDLLERGKIIVRQLLDVADDDEVIRTFDMLIYKPAGHPHETPWHQDLSYAGMPFAPAGSPPIHGLVQFWVPLDDVDEENSCMQFVPGHQDQPLLPHKVASGDPEDAGRLLAIDDPENHLDLTTKVVATLPAGGTTMHGYQTPHYTGPNLSADRPRRAYIFNLAPLEAVAKLTGK